MSVQIRLKDVLDRIECANSCAEAPTCPLGPRTLGEVDDAWEKDVANKVVEQSRIEDAHETNLCDDNVTDLMVSIVAHVEDPGIAFRSDRSESTLRWAKGPLKEMYQALRFPDKKPWPEFIATLMNPVNAITSVDCSIIQTLFSMRIGVARGKAVVLPDLILDSEFVTALLDIRTCRETTLGDLAQSAFDEFSKAETDIASITMLEMRTLASALAIRVPGRIARARLASQLSARLAALRVYSPTS